LRCGHGNLNSISRQFGPGWSMKAKTKTFDAVAECRNWREAVGKRIVGMTPEKIVAYFDRAAVHRRFNEALRRDQQAGRAKGESADTILNSTPK
jgi:hypothetical protein